jgi:hypothetical protein
MLRAESVIHAYNNAINRMGNGSAERIFGIQITTDESAPVSVYSYGARFLL